MKRQSWSPRIRSRACLRLILCLGTAWLWILSDSGAAAEITVRDDMGGTVHLDRPARRIIALYGALNEILGAMGMEDRIVARTNADRLPPSLVNKPSIGTHMRPNIELVLGNRPDLVIQMVGRRQQAADAVEALRRFGIKTAIFKTGSFEDLYSVIQRLGILTGDTDAAGNLIRSLEERLHKVQQSIPKTETAPRIFYEVRYPNLLAAGQGSIVADVIERAGGINCVTDPKNLVRLGEEELLHLDPDVYIIQKGPMNPSPIPLNDRPHYRSLKSVRNGRVLVVDEQTYSRPGPRNIAAVEELFGFLFPDRNTD